MTPAPPVGYVDIPDGQIHYRARPGDSTPIVFLHQTASSSRMWIEVMRRLDGVGRQVALDTPGFGQSFDPDGLPTMRQYGLWMLDAIDALGIGAFHLVGHHTGACIAVEIARVAPQRLRSATMIGPVPLTAEERAEFRQHYLYEMAPLPDGSHLIQTWEYVGGLGATGALRHRETLDTARAHRGRFQAYSAVWDQDFTTPFRTISCPMLLMCAPGDVLMPFFGRAREMRPDARAVVVGGTNFEPDEDPDGVAGALGQFLTSLRR